MVAVASWKQ